jgi:uroporphyrinogen decarboxylase
MSRSLWEPNFDRVLTVVNRTGEPDRVPFVELFHDAEIMGALLGYPWPADPEANRRFRIDFALIHNYDAVRGLHTVGFPDHSTLAADDTADLSRGQRGWQDEHHGPIGSWEDFEKYPWPTVRESDFEDVIRLAPMLPDGLKAYVMVPGGILENLVSSFGYEQLCFALIEQPDLVQAVVDKVGGVELAVYDMVCPMDHVGAVWLNDDLGFKTQTMISPRDLRTFVFPWHKRMVERAHSYGKPCLLHACGNLREVMDDLIDDVKIDAKHSFEDVIQPVAEFKRIYGSRVAALGGIDVDVLTRSTPDEIRAYTQKVLEACMPGGGFGLGSGNTVANYVPPENFLAMLEAGREVGVYGN